MILLRLLIAGALVLIGTLWAYDIAGEGGDIFGFNPLAHPNTHGITVGVAMFFGIISNSIWTHVAELPKNEPVSIGRVLKSALRSASLVRSALVSPIVFMAVYALVKSEPDAIVAHLLAYQNGFFWESVLRKQ